MGQKLECGMIRDLLPVYIERMTSEASDQAIREHLEECSECREVYRQMSQKVEVETAPEVKDFKKFLKKSKTRFAADILYILGAIAVLTCIIVNLAVDHGLTWSLIVTGGIATACIPVYIAMGAGNHRIVKGLAVLNLCSILLLGLIQGVLYGLMGIGDMWFWTPGLPIALMWTAVLWIGVACKMFTSANIVLVIAAVLFLVIPANILTNVLAGSYSNGTDFMITFVGNGLGTLVIAVIFLIIGIRLQRKKKNK